MRSCRPSILLAAACIALAIPGCAAAPTPPVAQASPEAALWPNPGSGVDPSLSPVPTEPVPASDPGPCDAVGPQLPADAGDPEQIDGLTLLTPIDRGPLPYANGSARLDDAGVPIAYTVAPNDNLESIGARFCLGGVWLHWVNSVRRNDDALFAGDTINLDAHTILSVGDQNGVVYDNPPPPFTIPPQR